MVITTQSSGSIWEGIFSDVCMSSTMQCASVLSLCIANRTYSGNACRRQSSAWYAVSIRRDVASKNMLVQRYYEPSEEQVVICAIAWPMVSGSAELYVLACDGSCKILWRWTMAMTMMMMMTTTTTTLVGMTRDWHEERCDCKML